MSDSLSPWPKPVWAVGQGKQCDRRTVPPGLAVAGRIIPPGRAANRRLTRRNDDSSSLFRLAETHIPPWPSARIGFGQGKQCDRVIIPPGRRVARLTIPLAEAHKTPGRRAGQEFCEAGPGETMRPTHCSPWPKPPNRLADAPTRGNSGSGQGFHEPGRIIPPGRDARSALTRGNNGLANRLAEQRIGRRPGVSRARRIVPPGPGVNFPPGQGRIGASARDSMSPGLPSRLAERRKTPGRSPDQARIGARPGETTSRPGEPRAPGLANHLAETHSELRPGGMMRRPGETTSRRPNKPPGRELKMARTRGNNAAARGNNGR